MSLHVTDCLIKLVNNTVSSAGLNYYKEIGLRSQAELTDCFSFLLVQGLATRWKAAILLLSVA